MRMTRGVVSVLVQELIRSGFDFTKVSPARPRATQATFLHVRTQDRLAIAVDVEIQQDYLMLCDFSGRQLGVEIYDTVFSIPSSSRIWRRALRKC